jgi:2'-5' RNA ligase
MDTMESHGFALYLWECVRDEGWEKFAQEEAASDALVPLRGQLVHETSVVIMPPPELWEPFLNIKKRHMPPHMKRPPFPHITLLAPFLPYQLFDLARSRLANVVSKVQPFRLHFSQLSILSQRLSSTLVFLPEAEPTDALVELENALINAVPCCDHQVKGGFYPHLSVAHFSDKDEVGTYCNEYQSKWEPVSFVVNEIYLMSRNAADQPFEVRHVIPLGSSA